MKLTENSKLVLKYLNLPHGLAGRGGVVQFMLMSNNIPYEDEIVNFSEWGAEKQRLLETGENPCGHVPLLYLQNGDGKADLPLSQHISMSRYVATIHQLSTGDEAAYTNYVQDLVSDEYQGFRNAWADAAFGNDNDVKAKYSEELPSVLGKFETLYKQLRTNGVFLGVSSKTGQPLWADAALFGLLRDHMRTGFLAMETLDKYPSLAEMFKAYRAIPAVAAWCDAKDE